MAKNGNRDPIVVWPVDGRLIILAGHHRTEICRRLKITLKKPVEMHFADKEGAKIWMLTEQFARRNLNQSQRAYLIGKRFLAEAPGQGARTDLGRGASAAERLAAEFHVTDRSIRDFFKPSRPKAPSSRYHEDRGE